MKKDTHNEHFWITTQDNFTNKILKDEKIIHLEDDKVVTAETHLAKIFKGNFENIVESLHIERPSKVDPVVSAIKNFSQHPSILKIKESTNCSACFLFQKVSKESLLYQLNGKEPTKATQKCDIPTNIIKKNYEIFSVLSNISKIYGRLLYKQLEIYFQYQCGFRKGFSVLTTLLQRNGENHLNQVVIL